MKTLIILALAILIGWLIGGLKYRGCGNIVIMRFGKAPFMVWGIFSAIVVFVPALLEVGSFINNLIWENTNDRTGFSALACLAIGFLVAFLVAWIVGRLAHKTCTISAERKKGRLFALIRKMRIRKIEVEERMSERLRREDEFIELYKRS